MTPMSNGSLEEKKFRKEPLIATLDLTLPNKVDNILINFFGKGL